MFRANKKKPNITPREISIQTIYKNEIFAMPHATRQEETQM